MCRENTGMHVESQHLQTQQNGKLTYWEEHRKQEVSLQFVVKMFAFQMQLKIFSCDHIIIIH